MKKLIVILLCVLSATYAGVYTRPSYILVGQLNWMDVLTKGYYVGSIPKLFTQGMLDESFFWVMKFSLAGTLLGVIISFLIGGKKSSAGSKKKKA